MLARLISAQQVVLLCDDSVTHLFYRGNVYIRPTEPHGFMNLPTHAPYNPIWALIDVGYEDRGPPLTGSTSVWPIQASSPNPVRFKLWSKQNGAAFLGLPPWSLKNLVEAYVSIQFYLTTVDPRRTALCCLTISGSSLLTTLRLCSSLCLQPRYDNLRSKLEECLPLLDGSTLPATGDSASDAMLQVLRTERGKKAVGGWDNNRDVVEAVAIDQNENMAGKVVWPLAHNVDDAIKALVRSATEEFGFAPGDVYKGVFIPGELRIQHANAMRDLDYIKLKELVGSFSLDRKLSDPSSCLVAVHPSPLYGARSDSWKIEFKSVRIAEKMVDWMRSEEDSHLQDMFNFFYRVPVGSDLAGWVFKAILHRMFSGGWQSGEPAPQPIYMTSQGHPPTFFTCLSLSSPFDGPPPLRAETRAIVRVDFTADSLGDVTLEGGNYYILPTAYNLLFDAFTIDVEGDTARISIFTITTSEEHGGSAIGYLHIGRIKTRVHDLLVEKGITHPVVIITYFLVCPNDRYRRWLKMPDGWGNQYHGRAFSIGIPSQYVTVRRSYPFSISQPS